MIRRSILFVSKGTHAASTRYRALNYFKRLDQNGWTPFHLTLHGLSARLELLRKTGHHDVTVILRKTFNPFYMTLLRIFSKHLIFDFDDAIFCRDNGDTLPRLEKRFARTIRSCHQIWAGNEYLAASAKKYNPSVLTLPTALETSRYDINVPKPVETFDLVWVGSSSTRKYLEMQIPLLERLSMEFPGVRLKILADFNITTEKLKTVAIPWEEKNEAAVLKSAHIGIAPMPDDPWTRGKCGLKILQYMAAGIPVIASPAGVNREIITHGVNGFLAETDDQWQKFIATLIQNNALRKQMGDAGKKQVIQNYSISAVSKTMLHQLKS